MNKSVKEKEFEKFRRAINISIDNLNKRVYELDRSPDKPATKREVLTDRNLNNAKFDTFEEAINLIFNILESHNLNIITCMHCKQPLPEDNNDN
jgi:hypothetical protein